MSGRKTELTATAAIRRLKLAQGYLRSCLEAIAAMEEFNPARAEELRRELKNKLLQILERM